MSTTTKSSSRPMTFRFNDVITNGCFDNDVCHLNMHNELIKTTYESSCFQLFELFIELYTFMNLQVIHMRYLILTELALLKV